MSAAAMERAALLRAIAALLADAAEGLERVGVLDLQLAAEAENRSETAA